MYLQRLNRSETQDTSLQREQKQGSSKLRFFQKLQLAEGTALRPVKYLHHRTVLKIQK